MSNIKMLYIDRIDVTERIDVDKTSGISYIIVLSFKPSLSISVFLVKVTVPNK